MAAGLYTGQALKIPVFLVFEYYFLFFVKSFILNDLANKLLKLVHPKNIVPPATFYLHKICSIHVNIFFRLNRVFIIESVEKLHS